MGDSTNWILIPGGISTLITYLDDIHDFLELHNVNQAETEFFIDSFGFHIEIEDPHIAILFKLQFC
jgi:hypothetical protein